MCVYIEIRIFGVNHKKKCCEIKKSLTSLLFHEKVELILYTEIKITFITKNLKKKYMTVAR